jgi:hypothetical protein
VPAVDEPLETVINASIEHFFYSLPESPEALLTKAHTIHALLVEAFAVGTAVQPGSVKIIREPKPTENSDDYLLFLLIADPCGQLLNLEKQFNAVPYLIADIQQALFKIIFKKFSDALKEMPEDLSKSSNNQQELAATFTSPVTEPSNHTPFVTRMTSRRLSPRSDDSVKKEWSLPYDPLKICQTHLNVSSKDKYWSVNLSISHTIAFPTSTYQHPEWANFRTFPRYGSVLEKNKILEDARRYSEKKATKAIVNHILTHCPFYQKTAGGNEYRQLLKIWVDVEKRITYVPINFALNTDLDNPGFKILVYEYYFAAVMSGKLNITVFENLSPQQKKILKEPAVINLQKNNICSFEEAISITTPLLAFLYNHLYLDMLLQKKISFLTFIKLTKEQLAILNTPAIRNLQSANPQITFHSVINLNANTVKLLSSEFYFNLLVQNKIQFHSLQRLENQEVDRLMLPAITNVLVDFQTISSSIIDLILDPYFNSLIVNKHISIDALENITSQQAANLTQKNIGLLIFKNILPLADALIMLPEKIKILSGQHMSRLLLDGSITLEQARQAPTRLAHRVENHLNVTFYLSINIFDQSNPYLLSFISVCDYLFSRLQGVLQNWPNTNEYSHPETLNSFQIVFQDLCRSHDITENEMLTIFIKLQLSLLKRSQLQFNVHPTSTLVRMKITEAQISKCDTIWRQKFDEILALANEPLSASSTLPFSPGGPCYSRIGMFPNTHQSHFINTSQVQLHLQNLTVFANALATLRQTPAADVVNRNNKRSRS